MTKIKMIIKTTVEYELNKDYYPENLSEKEMMDIDITNAVIDPGLFISLEGAKTEITGEILDDQK